MRTAALEHPSFVSSPTVSASPRQPHLSLASDAVPRRDQARHVHLTPRQRDVLALLCEGLPNKLICRRLNISPGTVKAHISSILRELGVSSRLQAVVTARESGVLDADCETSE